MTVPGAQPFWPDVSVAAAHPSFAGRHATHAAPEGRSSAQSRETPPRTVHAVLRADLAGRGSQVTIRLDSAAEPPITLRDGRRAIDIGVRRHWRPWAIAAADIDGSGRRALIVALYKPTRYLRDPHNCLFVYRYNGREAHPLWLGSSLGRPFSAFAFTPALPGRRTRLVTLDFGLDGRRGVGIHSWDGFGFRCDAPVGRWRTAKIVGVQADGVQVIADGRRRTVPIRE
ncbi:MAG TPA: hypothetical protein VKT77_21990 [Chthonomonadaceae bacterium]|nr:hypothetical protein [Chthonomonadaceae bacterium]